MSPNLQWGQNLIPHIDRVWDKDYILVAWGPFNQPVPSSYIYIGPFNRSNSAFILYIYIYIYIYITWHGFAYHIFLAILWVQKYAISWLWDYLFFYDEEPLIREKVSPIFEIPTHYYDLVFQFNEKMTPLLIKPSQLGGLKFLRN